MRGEGGVDGLAGSLARWLASWQPATKAGDDARREAKVSTALRGESVEKGKPEAVLSVGFACVCTVFLLGLPWEWVGLGCLQATGDSSQVLGGR